MQTKEVLIKQLKISFPDWNEEELEKYAGIMAEKYSTIKYGDNVIHLDYYGGLITAPEITEIETELKKCNLELSRFDKNGVPYASIEDFNLQMAIFLSDTLVQSVLLGLGTNALWDTIKMTTLFVWTKYKQRYWDQETDHKQKKNLNFGLKVKIDKNTRLELKMNGDFSEEVVKLALDKSIELFQLKDQKIIYHTDIFYIFNLERNEWVLVDKLAEIRKKHEQQNEH